MEDRDTCEITIRGETSTSTPQLFHHVLASLLPLLTQVSDYSAHQNLGRSMGRDHLFFLSLMRSEPWTLKLA